MSSVKDWVLQWWPTARKETKEGQSPGPGRFLRPVWILALKRGAGREGSYAKEAQSALVFFLFFLSLFFCSAQLELLPVPIATSCLLIPQALGPEYDKYQFSTGAKITLPKEWGNHPENKILFVWIVPLEMFWQTGSSGDFRASVELGSCLNYLHNCLPSPVCPGRRDLANHQLAFREHTGSQAMIGRMPI